MPETPDASVDWPAAPPAARWRVCLHEAGHVVAGVLLLKRTSRATVFTNGEGLADLGDRSAVPQSDNEAMAIAAGKAAESLSTEYPTPQVPQPSPVEVRYPQLAAHLKAELRLAMTDDVAVARWCIQGVEARPHRWMRRHDWLRDLAASFVSAHKGEIVEVATALFGCGIITLPVKPARKESPC